jgi:cell division protein FtsQ
LDVVIDERLESVLIAYAEGYAVVDYDGVILRLTEEALAIPVIAGLTPVEPKPGVALKAEEAGQLKPGLDFIKYVGEHDFYIKKLDLGGVIPRAYVFDLLVIEGELKNMEKSIEEIKRVIAYQDAQGVKRGTISVGSSSCTFSPEIHGARGQQSE